MATDKDVDAGKNLETQKDVDTTKATATGEPSIEYLVDGLTEDQLKGVSGGLAAGEVAKTPMRCVGVSCDGFNSKCYAFCTTMSCPHVNCEEIRCTSFQMS